MKVAWFVLGLVSLNCALALAQGKYRGRLNSNPYDSDSVSNPYGAYGSPYSPDSVQNPYGAGNPYSNPDRKIYDSDGNFRGNLNNNRYDPDSVSNPYGQFGSQYSPDSINNPYGKFGSPYSDESPNNPYGRGLRIYDGK